jgi:hypothetical protein
MTTATDAVAAEVRAALAKAGEAVREVKMFGGIGFMLNGNMVAALSKRGLMLRIGRERHVAALARPGVRIVEMRGRAMPGYVSVDPTILIGGALDAWLDEAVAFVRTLPPKIANVKPEQKKSQRKGVRK